MSAQSQHTHTNSCHEVLAHLNDYIDGELAPELCEALEAHLEVCEDCRVVFDTLNKTLYLVHQLRNTSPQLPETVEYRLFAVLNLEQFVPKKPE
ncbi:MAG TPA: zf-HC2 domain-containing protein [Anaerolineae bacterium]|nr:zf-HC2 domain-containing protein [Anaerolineae bacterium]